MRFLASLFFVSMIGALVAPAELCAQTDGKFALGGGVMTKQAPHAESRGSTGLGLVWRVGHGHEGWGWKYGLNWYSAELERPIGGSSQEFGELNIKPFMGGYGYTRTIGTVKVSANLLGGYAFSSFSVRDGFEHSYLVNNHVDSLDVDASNTWVVKPEVSTWFDLARKVGLNLSVGYMVARPELTVTTPLGRQRERINADVIMIKVGAVYSIF